MATDLKAFQNRLNTDSAFRSEFLKDPVKTLEAAGLILPDAAKKHLTELVRDLRTKPSLPDSGPPEICIEIS
jgi:hypothetical protein